jgi:hypothetical protein
MKPKAQTMSQRFGFMDPDLTAPNHDAIMLWLDGEMKNIVKRYYPQPWRWNPLIDYQNPAFPYSRIADDMWEEARKRCQSMSEQIITELSLEDTPSPIVKKVWESPIVDRAYTIGFCDMVAYWKFPAVNCRFNVVVDAIEQESGNYPRWIAGETKWEYAGSSVDVPDYFLEENKAYFEVKPSIPSLGEVIRQVRMYQTYTRGAKWCIVSPDARFKEQIEAQGIKFLVVPSSI